MDAGCRKPHPEIFATAVAAAGCPAERCIMVCNSERNDIDPALALGMRAIRVTIEEPPPRASSAHAVAVSLAEVMTVLGEWALAAPAGG